jgi:hypothetical protein
MMTDAVRCMADTRASPSWIPLPRMMRSTSLVIGRISLRFLVLKVRYAVYDFMRLFLLGQCNEQHVEGTVSYKADDIPSSRS